MCSNNNTVYGHKMPNDFVLLQERSQLHAYNTNILNPEGRGFEVYIYKLPRDILIQYIYKFMRQSGEIYDIRVLMDFSGFNRGMCYVKFSTKMAARKAVLVLDGCEIVPDHRVHLRMSFDNNKLVMQKIPKRVPLYQVRELLTSIIGEGVTLISLEDQQGDQASNCCFLTYENHRKALEARRKLWPGIELWNTMIPIEWAEPPELKESRVLYFKNFPENASRLELFEVLTNTIDVHSVLKLHLDQGIGCIVFSGHDSRKESQRILTDCRILGRKLFLSHRKFQTSSPFKNETTLKAIGEENKTLKLVYQSCSREMLDLLPTFYPPAVLAPPGFYNELEAIQSVIHSFLEREFPNSFWTCLDPDELKVRSHVGAIRVRPTVTNEMYEFVLLCVSSELASGCAGFNK